MGRKPLKGTISVDIAADIDAVYEMVSDHAKLCKIDDMFVKVKVRSVRPSSAVNEETISLNGRTYKCMVKHLFAPPYTHSYAIVGGDAKGSQIIQTLQKIPDGTKVTLDIQWKEGLFRLQNNKNILQNHTTLLHSVKSNLES